MNIYGRDKFEAVRGILDLEKGDVVSAIRTIQRILEDGKNEERLRIEQLLRVNGLTDALERTFQEVCGEEYPTIRKDIESSRERDRVSRCFSLFNDVQAILSALDLRVPWAFNAPIKVQSALGLGARSLRDLQGCGVFSAQEIENLHELLSKRQPSEDYTVECKLEFFRLFLLARDRILELYDTVDKSLIADFYPWQLPDIHREVDVVSYSGLPLPNLIASCFYTEVCRRLGLPEERFPSHSAQSKPPLKLESIKVRRRPRQKVSSEKVFKEQGHSE